MAIFSKKVSVIKQDFTVPVTIAAEDERQARDAAKALSVIATFFSAKELSAVQKALNNPAIRTIIKSKL